MVFVSLFVNLSLFHTSSASDTFFFFFYLCKTGPHRVATEHSSQIHSPNIHPHQSTKMANTQEVCRHCWRMSGSWISPRQMISCGHNPQVCISPASRFISLSAGPRCSGQEKQQGTTSTTKQTPLLERTFIISSAYHLSTHCSVHMKIHWMFIRISTKRWECQGYGGITSIWSMIKNFTLISHSK